MPDWKRCEEEMPDDDRIVIARAPGGWMHIASWNTDEKKWRSDDSGSVVRAWITHWQPLPAQPKDDE